MHYATDERKVVFLRDGRCVDPGVAAGDLLGMSLNVRGLPGAVIWQRSRRLAPADAAPLSLDAGERYLLRRWLAAGASYDKPSIYVRTVQTRWRVELMTPNTVSFIRPRVVVSVPRTTLERALNEQEELLT